MLRRRSIYGLARAGLRVLLPTLVLAGFVTGGRPPMSQETQPLQTIQNCGDLMHPLQVRVTPDGPIRRGAVVTATVEITSRADLDAVQLRLQSPADVALLSNPGRALGRFKRGDTRTESFSVVAPRGNERRMVHVFVDGVIDGQTVTRGAALNLVFEEEPFRIATAPDGSEIREVQARRVGR